MQAVMTLASSQTAHAIWTKGEVFLILLAFRYDYFRYSTWDFTIWATKVQTLSYLTQDFSAAKIIFLLVSR